MGLFGCCVYDSVSVGAQMGHGQLITERDNIISNKN